MARGKRPQPFSPDIAPEWPRLFIAGLLAAILAGIVLRVIHIRKAGFFFYDAGLYLNYGRILLEPYANGTEGVGRLIQEWLTAASRTDRPLWQLVVDFRVFWGGLAQHWGQTRYISMIFGLLTLPLAGIFAKRFFNSTKVALLSVALLAVLPSHVFYSRSLLPESFSTLLVLSGFYFYFCSGNRLWRVMLSGFFLAASFFTNYRLFVLPLLLGAAEFFMSRVEQRPLDIKKWGTSVGVAAGMVVLLCLLSDGSYARITSAWMFHQASKAVHGVVWYSVFSYPYEIFRLEGVVFGTIFFAGSYFVWKKRRTWALPFVLACLQMLIFSISADKAARYMSIVMPFKAMAVAAVVVTVWEDRKAAWVKNAVLAVTILMLGTMTFKSAQLVSCRSGYRPAMKYMTQTAPDQKILSTQPLIMNLYTKDRLSVVQCPRPRDMVYFRLPKDEYKYIVLGPQAFVSWTEDGVAFSGPLDGVPGFFWKYAKPVQTVPHLNKAMLERFVFEHNQDLARSVAFLSGADDDFGNIRIYNFDEGMALLKRMTGRKTEP